MFCGQAVIESYQSDGGYSTTVTQADGRILVAYYAGCSTRDKPDIHLADLGVK